MSKLFYVNPIHYSKKIKNLSHQETLARLVKNQLRKGVSNAPQEYATDVLVTVTEITRQNRGPLAVSEISSLTIHYEEPMIVVAVTTPE